jgi:hypothetical protein
MISSRPNFRGDIVRLSLGLILSIALVLCGCGDNNDTTGGTGGDGGTGGAAGAGGMGRAAVGDLQVLASVSSTMANTIDFQILCGDLLDVSGALELEDAPSGLGQVAENTFLDLPVGTCDVTLTVRDDEGAAACTGSVQADVVAEETAMVSIPVICPEPPE